MDYYTNTKNLRDRVITVDGISTIRPINRVTGRIMGTPQEQAITVEEFQRQLNERARDWERNQLRYVEKNL